jgi:hypothetical protein
MKRGSRKAAEKVSAPEPGETAARPRRGRLPQFDYLSVDGLARHLGGRRKFIDLARLSTEELVRSVVARWDALTKSKQGSQNLDNLVADCGLDPGWFVGKVSETMFSNGVEVTKLLMAIATPAVIQHSIEQSLTGKNGFKDRELLLKAARVLPSAQPPQHNMAFMFGGTVPQIDTDNNKEAPKQIEGSTEPPAVEDGNVIDQVFRELDENEREP